ncbi:hypothetical protein F4824DRAFT_497637 [Ustulina deusta]|nr:hypothetical protein F4824DRAFT_497637 [Ustulina deusta]
MSIVGATQWIKRLGRRRWWGGRSRTTTGSSHVCLCCIVTLRATGPLPVKIDRVATCRNRPSPIWEGEKPSTGDQWFDSPGPQNRRPGAGGGDLRSPITSSITLQIAALFAPSR